MSDPTRSLTGGCYCGEVRYRVRNVRNEVTECHCSQCRKQSGHRYAVVDAKPGDLEIEGADPITWFPASPVAKRGFCSVCGSHLFWWSLEEDDVGILAGSVDEPTGLELVGHIFVRDKGDYYEIADGLPQVEGSDDP